MLHKPSANKQKPLQGESFYCAYLRDRTPTFSPHSLYADVCRFALVIIFLLLLQTAKTWAENADVQWLPPAVLETRYSVALPIRGGEGGLSWEVENDLPPGLHSKDGRITGVPERVGAWQFGVTVRDELNETLQTTFGIRVLPAPAPELRIVSRRLPVAHRLTSYSGTLHAKGAYPPYTWIVSAKDLPPWAKLEGNKIQGTPQKADAIGLYRFKVSVRDDQGNTTGPVNVTLPVKENPLVQPLGIKPSAELAPAVIDMRYREQIQASGGVPPYRLSIETDCPGLEYKGNGVLSGKATEEGEFSVSVSLVDADRESRKKQLRLTVVAPAATEMSVGTIKAMSGLTGKPVTVSVPVAGGLKPYESKLATRLPPGLEWDAANRIISGIPTQTGEWECHLEIIDATEHTQRVRFPIRIQSAAKDIPDQEPTTEETGYFEEYWFFGAMAVGWLVAACLAVLLWVGSRRIRKHNRNE